MRRREEPKKVDIDIVMARFRDLGLSAMGRYSQVSGELPDELPEYFMASYIFDHIGSDVAATLETSFRKLEEWNNDVRRRRQQPFPNEELELYGELGGPLVDMVLHQRIDADQMQDEFEFLALVEFKKGEFFSDRAKLLGILKYIDTCQYGVTCGSVRGRPNLEFHQRQVQESGDRWFPSSPLRVGAREFFFCVRLFERGAPL